MRRIGDNKGSATILTILISAVVMTVGIGFNWIVKERLKDAQSLNHKSLAMLRVYSAYNTVLYAIVSGRIASNNVILAADDSVLPIHSLPLNGTSVNLPDDVRISVQDTNGMLSLTSVNDVALGRLTNLLRDGKGNPAEFVSSLLDWIDADTLVRVNGAEESEYRMLSKPYGPRNYPIQYKEEISLVKGMDDELFRKILPYLTILPVTGFNPNTASDEVLTAYLDISKDTLDTFKTYVASKPVTSDIELFSLTGRRISGKEEGVYFFPSGCLEVIIQAGNPRTEYSIKTGIDLKQTLASPYTMAYWKEE